ncbi:hypothetical protein CYMTET_35500 [Cymbomonas tetramitiformis]|uniref:Chloride conductance regulatory protein ICln n=1 Tax=Cymbomonas tetramitiformis TaxID=36881 RepID=A0AAE0F930_9CHLO|nr:hypothetical protein CYMTET_35500 [Cymbomonas tetramitiformis]|eukprot:gene22246-26831_t
MEELPAGVEAVSNRDGSGSLIVNADDEEEIKYVMPNVSVLFGQEPVEATAGTVYVTTRRVAWLGESQGFGVTFRSITMHAISRDPEAHSQPCIYTQVESPESLGIGDDEDIEVTEMRLIPGDSEKLDELFRWLCDCAALNPDPDFDDQEDGAGEFYFDEEEIINGVGAEDRANMLDRFDAMLEMPTAGDFDQLISEDPGRFEDEDEGVVDDRMSNGA